MTKASDNAFPSLLITEGTEPSAPAAGKQRLYIDSTTHLLKATNSSGTDRTIEGASGAITTSGLTMATARLLGRTTASTGAVEEITVGSGLSLTAGALTATGGGGGLAQSFVGYNTVGGTFVACTSARYICKKVTLAAAGLVTSIDCYIHSNDTAAATTVVIGVILADNSNAPGMLIGGNKLTPVYFSENVANANSADRWFSIPVSAYLAAGSYWFGVMNQSNTSIAKDGSGSDQYFTMTGGGATNLYITGAIPGTWAITTSTDKYSIRASILS